MGTKQEIRDRLKLLRDRIPEFDRVRYSSLITGRLQSLIEFEESKAILFYVSTGSEVITRSLIENCFGQKKVLVPYVNGRHLEAAEVSSFAELIPGVYGILKPKTKKNSSVIPDLIIVPGIGFDINKNRIGYGKGYYDKFLKTDMAKKALKIGLAFDIQILPNIPKEKHDVQMDIVITETKVI